MSERMQRCDYCGEWKDCERLGLMPDDTSEDERGGRGEWICRECCEGFGTGEVDQ